MTAKKTGQLFYYDHFGCDKNYYKLESCDSIYHNPYLFQSEIEARSCGTALWGIGGQRKLPLLH